MAMPVQHTNWTAEMARALPDDGKRYEVLNGELFVSPAPSRLHQRAVREMLLILDAYCRKHGYGEALDSPADIEFSDKDLLQPDVFVVPEIQTSWREVTTLSVAVEILSPSTARADRYDKKKAYQRYRVPEYWIVDLDARMLERWHPDDSRPEVLSDVLTWRPSAEYPVLEIDLPAYFDRVFAQPISRGAAKG
jgi:Uma2 family endonuclease